MIKGGQIQIATERVRGVDARFKNATEFEFKNFSAPITRIVA